MSYFHCDDCNVKVSNNRVKLFHNHKGKEYRGIFCPFCDKSMRREYGGESDE